MNKIEKEKMIEQFSLKELEEMKCKASAEVVVAIDSILKKYPLLDEILIWLPVSQGEEKDCVSITRGKNFTSTVKINYHVYF